MARLRRNAHEPTPPTSTSIESVTRCTRQSRAIIYTLAVALSRNASRSISPRRGVPVITAIRARTDATALDVRDASEPLREITYRFEDIRFPAELPAWLPTAPMPRVRFRLRMASSAPEPA
jgi:hypothetical protein